MRLWLQPLGTGVRAQEYTILAFVSSYCLPAPPACLLSAIGRCSNRQQPEEHETDPEFPLVRASPIPCPPIELDPVHISGPEEPDSPS